MSLPDPILALFKLGWPADPSLLEARRKAMGVQHYVAEIAAWCAEINEQLDELAARRGMPLVLMGGNAGACAWRSPCSAEAPTTIETESQGGELIRGRVAVVRPMRL